MRNGSYLVVRNINRFIITARTRSMGRVMFPVCAQHGRSCVRAPAQAIGLNPGSDLSATNARGYIWQLQVQGSKWLSCHAVYTLIYCVHFYWGKRQVSHQMWPLGSLHASKNECRWEIHSGFETREEGHTKSKTGAISGSTNCALVQQKILKKKVFSLCVCPWGVPTSWPKGVSHNLPPWTKGVYPPHPSHPYEQRGPPYGSKGYPNMPPP